MKYTRLFYSPRYILLVCSRPGSWNWRLIRLARNLTPEPATDRMVGVSSSILASIEELVNGVTNGCQTALIFHTPGKLLSTVFSKIETKASSRWRVCKLRQQLAVSPS